MLVEFADMQCPHCKDAQGTMDQIVKDFPNARVVYQSFPLVEIHPFAFKAAAYGYCVFSEERQGVLQVRGGGVRNVEALTPADPRCDAEGWWLRRRVLDPAAVDACAATQATKDQVNASVKLAEDAGVDQTPMLAINGHILPLTGIPYETLKQIISYQASLDGVTGATTTETQRFGKRSVSSFIRLSKNQECIASAVHFCFAALDKRADPRG